MREWQQYDFDTMTIKRREEIIDELLKIAATPIGIELM